MKNFFLYDPKLLIYGFLIIFFASYGQTFFISLFNIEIRTHYNLTDGQFGFVYAVATTLSSILLINFAKLIDYIDLRLYSFIVSIGIFLACLGMFFLFKHLAFLFFIIFALRFFGQGAMSHAGETTMARYFGKNRGKAISIATLGGMIGVMFLPIIVINLMKNYSINEIWLIASFTILLFIPLLFIALSNQSRRHVNFKKTISNENLNKKWKTREVITNSKFYTYLPLSIAPSFISTGLMFHQIFIFNQKGWSMEMLGKGYLLVGLFSIAGLLIGGPIIDKFNTRKTVLTGLFPLFVCISILLFFDNYFFFIIYMCFYGLNFGITIPFFGALWAEIYGVESLGTVKALLHAGGVLASALSPLVFGYLIDWGFGILTIVFISGLIIIFSTLLPLYKKLP
ncbi:MAG: hypothetical protein CFH15_00632 [Alphaproteobacteria bacterium MarineAlpha5_Bin5]|nr:MAG: hypothetical protein CFH15_00632 [Alphaproteobacteria bacterium MarineAlpha5_Bin5]PPR52504.1 MAG: hypothetical protein CFH14_00259 [Alphaproteobacteria bacterium MarineAlpha5_Bin4]|tara:strand:- start:1882 stop:3075 length:1194 start_codon:yes stop_codon:yes gene_type:complete